MVAVVKLAYLQGRNVQGLRSFPCRFVGACPIKKEQRFAITAACFKDFLDVPLLLSSNDRGGRRWLLLSLKRIVGWGLEEGDVDYWMDFHGGRKLEFICNGASSRARTRL